MHRINEKFLEILYRLKGLSPPSIKVVNNFNVLNSLGEAF